MAVAIDTSLSTSSESYSYTCSGSDRYLIAIYTIDTTTITSASYNGVGMTELWRQTSGSRVWVMFGLVAPASGANTLAITSGGTWGGGGAMSFTGVDQTTPVDTIQTATGTGTTASVSVSSATNNLVAAMAVAIAGSITFTAGSGETVAFNRTVNGVTSLAIVTESGASSVSLDPTLGSAEWHIGGIDLNAVSVATTWGPQLAMDHNRLVQG